MLAARGARRSLPTLLLLALAAPPAGAAEGDTIARGLAVLDGAEPDGAAAWRPEARLVLGEEEIGEGHIAGVLELELAASRLAAGGALRVTLVVTRIDGEPFVESADLAPPAAAGAGVLFRLAVAVPAALQDAAVVVEEAAGVVWGAAPVKLADRPAEPPAGYVVVESPGARVAAAPAAAAAPPPVIRILPPGEEPLAGKVRFRTLVTLEGVRRVDFLLDGEEAASDSRPPFTAVLDLGTEAAPHRIEAVAWGSGVELGRAAIEVNRERRPFRVALRRQPGRDAAGQLAFAAEISVPADEELVGVVFFRNEQLVAALDRPPWEVLTAAGGAGSTDFLRVVARLANGAEREDVAIVAAQLPGDRVEVNLVELYAFVANAEGEPVRGLERGDFAVSLGGRPVEVQRFAHAEDVPLVLGLVIDSSGSMFPHMVETRQAAAAFLAATLAPGDRAFLVDFDSRPRLARGLTASLVELARGLGELRAEGDTALYDSLIFATLQFEREPGRRAVVLLTDGVEGRSRYGRRRTIEIARDHGVPLYSIVLLGPERPLFRNLGLEHVCRASGGRTFYIETIDELAAVYARIEAELRSQYLLALATDEPLTRAELGSIEVAVPGREHRVRTASLRR